MVTVQEGRLLELPTRAATGMERRAFGEFVGSRGELASYALGWATDVDPPVGRITIGIGAGNPGGGTFHAVVVPHGAGHLYHAVDEDPTLIDVLDLEAGHIAIRAHVGGPWTRRVGNACRFTD